MNEYVPTDHLWTEFNGGLEFDYEHAVYWPALNALCEERRAARRQRWEAGGSNIGESEDYLNGAAEHGVAGPSAKEEEEAKPEDLRVDGLKVEDSKTEEPQAEEAS